MQAKDRDMQILEKIIHYCADIEHAHGEYHRRELDDDVSFQVPLQGC